MIKTPVDQVTNSSSDQLIKQSIDCDKLISLLNQSHNQMIKNQLRKLAHDQETSWLSE